MELDVYLLYYPKKKPEEVQVRSIRDYGFSPMHQGTSTK